ncbi:hypothetical protein [Actinokineospora bangkokensis]|uniref:Uncharacterized protein n=1 Tax=Actinokineospora bangkokensis TaxID=1193682 RepID=A0A1Q9LEU6_9PSEU|nr:hypothetical protein [Actinokineospora bangkokensis]OLR90556.1 hypothetical protein BJP25_28445 [Actinokineospora bangkokensis]
MARPGESGRHRLTGPEPDDSPRWPEHDEADEVPAPRWAPGVGAERTVPRLRPAPAPRPAESTAVLEPVVLGPPGPTWSGGTRYARAVDVRDPRGDGDDYDDPDGYDDGFGAVGAVAGASGFDEFEGEFQDEPEEWFDDDSDADDADDTDGAEDEDDEDTVILPLPLLLVPQVPALVESPATGLAKFDLGTIPASVTPPRSWRRAAWFAVGAAVLVVVGLSVAAVALMGTPRDPLRVDALPALPSGEPQLPTTWQDHPAVSTSSTSSAPSSAPSATSTTAAPPAQASEVPSAPAQAPTAGGPSSAPTPSSAPPRTTVSTPVLLAAPADPQALGDRTEQYFHSVVADPAAAYELTTGSMRQAGQGAIEQRYADVRRVEVTAITIDPSRATTRAALRVVGTDGSVQDLDRELVFTSGDDPMITSERPVS